MIIVIGSRFDPIANDLVASWSDAALCSVEDLVCPGWVWSQCEPESRTWVVNGRRVRDQEITGVFTRRSTIYAEELTTTHPTDRAFLASEIHAFLTFVLATTSARVVNPVSDGAFGEEALRPERWPTAALAAGLSVRPFHVSSEPRRQSRYRVHEVEVVGEEVFTEAPAQLIDPARSIVAGLGLVWAVLLFDRFRRLVTVTEKRRPSPDATSALGRLLTRRA